MKEKWIRTDAAWELRRCAGRGRPGGPQTAGQRWDGPGWMGQSDHTSYSWFIRMRRTSQSGLLAHAVREVTDLRPRIAEADAIDALKSIEQVWDELFPAGQARIAHTLMDRITVRAAVRQTLVGWPWASTVA